MFITYKEGISGFLFGALGIYILALMTKPIVTPLPVMLILLDIWPLQQFRWREQWNKIPFFIIAAVSAYITVISQSKAGLQDTSVLDSFYTICHNLFFYPWKMIWPVDLNPHYPYPDPLNLSHPHVIAAVIFSLVSLVLIIVSLRKTRALLIGASIFFCDAVADHADSAVQ